MLSPVLITGATGFIGAHLAGALVDAGASVVALARPGSARRRLQLLGKAVTIVEADVGDAAAVRAVLTRAKPQLLFHLAARGVRPAERDRAEMLRINVLGTETIVEEAARCGVERLVLCGGSSEYGHVDAPMRESLRPAPVTAYGASKAAATLLACQAARDLSLALVVLRPFTVYGPLEPGHRLIPTAIRAALGHLPLPLTGPGLRHDYVYVADVVEAFVAAGGRSLPAGEIINVGTGVESTNEEVVAEIERQTGARIDVQLGAYAAHPSDHGRWVADTTKARALLGVTPRYPLARGIAAMAAFARAHGTDW
ncbi:MAG: NAD-dependent epimerase/dehydratase family protein [Deltaproteobacteria bacterium]|nr:NAD-dependent epimerase/dehydratase family protein [Deltaproteobacteria bacterium]